ncbi:hypothetical protein MRX96_027397 [Rhipicephalus microplus]
MNKLYIGNIPADVNEGSIRELFHQQTGVVPKSMLLKKGGYAFVECSDNLVISKAIEALNRRSFMGSQLLVEPQQSTLQNRRGHGNRVHAQQAVAQLRDYEYQGSVLRAECTMDVICNGGGGRDGGRNNMRMGGKPAYVPALLVHGRPGFPP